MSGKQFVAPENIEDVPYTEGLSYFALKVLGFVTPIPLGISNELGYGFFLEKKYQGDLSHLQGDMDSEATALVRKLTHCLLGND